MIRHQVGPVLLSHGRMDDALQFVSRCVEERANRYVCFCEANLLSKAVRDKRVAEVLNRSAATFADGVAVAKLSSLYGRAVPERIPGPTFFLKTLEHGLSRGWRHYFYGGAPGVADTLAERMRTRFPSVNIVGTYSPPFRSLDDLREDDEVLAAIEAAAPDFLWVGLGGPKQELWMAEHAGRLQVPLMLGVGAAFDFHSGTRPWAPAWIRKAGMEWAYRMVTGGRETFVRNIRCVTATAGVLARAALETRLGIAYREPQTAP